MFHTRAEGSVSQSLWLHLGISLEDPREDRSIGRASRRFPPSASALLLSQSLRNELVSKMFAGFRFDTDLHATNFGRLLLGSGGELFGGPSRSRVADVTLTVLRVDQIP
jgi:hypothetical protein